jgi:hypothetical protein
MAGTIAANLNKDVICLMRAMVRIVPALAAAAFITASVALTAPVLAATPKPETAKTFQPHKAIYRMQMSAVRNLQKISAVSGEMFFEWSDACDAWTTTQKFQLDYGYVEGGNQRFVTDYTSWEAKDGHSFSFTSKNSSNGKLHQVYRGSAERAKDGKGEADFSRPEEKVLNIPTGFLFPSEHTFRLLEAAKSGKKIFSAVMFDGSDDEGPILVNAVLGNKIAARTADEEENELLRGAGWPVRMAFFNIEDENSPADYEMSITLLENGIVRDMAIDYDDFSLEGELVTLEALDSCK